MEYYALARELDGILCPHWGAGWNTMPSLGSWMEFYALTRELDGILCPRWGAGWNILPSLGSWMEYFVLLCIAHMYNALYLCK